MKNILSITILAVTAALAVADDKPLAIRLENLSGNIVEKTREIVHATRDAAVDTTKRADIGARAMWIKSDGYLSEDPTIYRLGAEQHLAGLGEEIALVKMDAGIEPPSYFRTRVLALEQQHAYLTVQLPRLTPEQIKARMSGGRFAFDQCIETLEEALDQAQREARRFVKIALK